MWRTAARKTDLTHTPNPSPDGGEGVRQVLSGTAPPVAPVLPQSNRQRHQPSQEHVPAMLQLGIGHGESQPRIAAEESLEADLGFDPGQLGSQTEVNARAKTDVRVAACV